MNGRALLAWIATCIVGVGRIAPVHAQLPADCSGADEDRTAGLTRSAVEALRQGDAKRAIGQLREIESGLSQGCRAALDRLYPARVRCAPRDRKLILDGYQVVFAGALRQDYPRVFASLDEMEASVSPPCWLAVNHSVDPGVRAACSIVELDHTASFVGPLRRAQLRMLASGDGSEWRRLIQDWTAGLSPACNEALAMEMWRKSASTSSGSSPQLPYVEDHGGGTYSVPGLGACTPSECMAF